MSLEAMIWVKNDAPVKNTTEMCLLYALADHAHPDGTGAWPSYRALADNTRSSRSTVIRHIKELERRGLIVRGDQSILDKKGYPRDRRPVVWDLNLALRRDHVGPESGAKTTGCQPDTPQERGTNGAQTGYQRRTDGVPPVHERGASSGTQTIHNPPLTQHNPPLSPSGVKQAEPQQQELDGVEPAPAKKRATRVAPDFMPTSATVDGIRAKLPGVTDEWLEWEHDKFVDFWAAKSGAGATKLDWEATWRNWMRNAWERGGGASKQGASRKPAAAPKPPNAWEARLLPGYQPAAAAPKPPNAWEARLQKPAPQPPAPDYATDHTIIDQESQ